MKKILSLTLVLILFLTGCSTALDGQETNYAENVTYSSMLFQITLPKELARISEVVTLDDQISVYFKEAKDAGFGGLVYFIKAYRSPDEYAGGPLEKIGELSDQNAEIYDIVKGFPTEVQWDYNDPEMPEGYGKLSEAAGAVIESMQGLNGFTYIHGAGTKGEDLYNTVLSKYVKAVNENWDAAKYQMEDMSPDFPEIINEAESSPLETIGYAYADINNDGVDELFVGIITGGELKGVALDIYTMVDRIPTHVTYGLKVYRYYNYEDDFVANEWGDSTKYGLDVYNIEPNSTEMIYQRGYKYDTFENAKEPWFGSYDGEEYEPVSEEEFTNEIKEIKDNYLLFDFKPLSGNEDAIAGANVPKVGENGGLPAYEYPGPELFYTVMYRYIIDEFGKHYDPADVGIPCPIIVAEDYSDENDMKVWGIFQYYNYILNGDTLECVSGGSYPGCMHLTDTEEGYEVTGFDAVGDGSDHDPSARKIFGEHYDEFIKKSADDKECERIRAQIIADYVAANDLSITEYKDYGWDPVVLPGEVSKP